MPTLERTRTHGFIRTNTSIQSKPARVACSLLLLGLCFLAEERAHPLSAPAFTHAAVSGQASFPRAQMSQQVVVRAIEQGQPRLQLSDGRAVLTAYDGPAELVQALAANRAEPRALAAADFDEDSVPDLISGYADAGAGIVTLLRGNVDAIYPNTPEAQQRKAAGMFTDAPFLSPALVYAVPEAADFIGAGDFDGDSHWDVVTAARGGSQLHLLAGDGNGGFSAPQAIALPGALTAMLVGEVNRRDGLDEVVVGVNSASGAQVLVFEGPHGALRAGPEVFAAPAAVSGFALGNFTGESAVDLAVAAGNELLIIHGRDRRLSLDEIRQAEVPAAQITRRALPFAVKALEVGDFSDPDGDELALLADDGALYVLSARETIERNQLNDRHDWDKLQRLTAASWPGATTLLCARMTGAPHDDLVLADAAQLQLHVVSGGAPESEIATATHFNAAALPRAAVSLQTAGAPVALLKMRLNRHARNSLVLLRDGDSNPAVMEPTASAVFTVTTTADAGPGSLREAINSANANPDADTIEFKIGNERGRRSQTITLLTALPEITYPVTIDGSTQSDMPCRFCGQIELSGNRSFDGLVIISSGCVVRGLVINRFNRGIYLTTPSNSSGSNTRIEGNFIGTDVSGSVAIGNADAGIQIENVNGIVVGGTAPPGRNVISANNGEGIAAILTFTSIGIEVRGNFIGTDLNGQCQLDSDGQCALGNGRSGINISNPQLVERFGPGGLVVNNIISGNKGDGILLNNVNAIVQGNLIGTDVTGQYPLGNKGGGVIHLRPPPRMVVIFLFPIVTIGGTTDIFRNIISANGSDGISFQLPGRYAVSGNFIGTNKDGTVALANRGSGVAVSSNAFPDESDGSRYVGITGNLISGNNGDGLSLNNVYNIDVEGNHIGTDKDHKYTLPNGKNGVRWSSCLCLANHRVSIRGNFICGNLQHGVAIVAGGSNSPGIGTGIEGNFIGTDDKGLLKLGNGQDGVFVDNDSRDHTIENNTIAFNGRNGVFIPKSDFGSIKLPGVRIKITSNSIFSNTKLGIALCQPDGIGNTNCGANGDQRPPSVINTTMANGRATLSVIPPGKPGEKLRLEFFVNSLADAGASPAGVCKPTRQKFIEAREVTVSGASVEVTFTLPPDSPGNFVSATAINLTTGNNINNTSEYSACSQPPGLIVREVELLPERLVIKAVAVLPDVKVFLSNATLQQGQDLEFDRPAVISQEADGTRVITQAGNLKLPDGKLRTLAEAIPPGATVRLKLLNGNGGLTEVSFKN